MNFPWCKNSTMEAMRSTQLPMKIQSSAEWHPLKGIGNPEDQANAIEFLPETSEK